MDKIIKPANAVNVGLPPIKAIFSDVDGVLNDGFYIDDKGSKVFKKWNPRDLTVVKRLKDNGLMVFFITASDDAVTKARVDQINPTGCFYGVTDKLSAMKQIMAECDLSQQEVIYIGDDYIDIPCLQYAGYSYCPADGSPTAQYAADLALGINGGQGVLAYVGDAILVLEQHITVQRGDQSHKRVRKAPDGVTSPTEVH